MPEYTVKQGRARLQVNNLYFLPCVRFTSELCKNDSSTIKRCLNPCPRANVLEWPVMQGVRSHGTRAEGGEDTDLKRRALEAVCAIHVDALLQKPLRDLVRALARGQMPMGYTLLVSAPCAVQCLRGTCNQKACKA